jgi:hypothetical protein
LPGREDAAAVQQVAESGAVEGGGHGWLR